MTTVLFLNHTVPNCGVYQYGLRVYDILKMCTTINYKYFEIESLEQYNNLLSNCNDIKCILYNYHQSTMSWLNGHTIQRRVKNIGIPHESNSDFFDLIINIDPSDINNPYSSPRPLFENIDELFERYSPSTNKIKEFINYSEPDIPIIGSFGFGFDNKGFHKIIEKVNNEYEVAIIKLVIPVAHFDPNGMNTVVSAKDKCIAYNTKPGIKLLITHDFFTNEDLLVFLQSNTINIFMYDRMDGRGISSTIDYALSVKRPLGISDSFMFRHIYNSSIDMYKTSISECIQTSVQYYNRFNIEWSNSELINKFKTIINN